MSKVFGIFGANTDVLTTGLIRSMLQKELFVNYIKPIQTGSAFGHSDSKFIKQNCDNNNKNYLKTLEIYSWDQPLSPHIAATYNKPTDINLLQDTRDAVEHFSCDINIIETAGGVLSPGPNSTLQADLYRPLFKDVIFVGDGKLGGISTTLSSIESLLSRNYTISSVLLLETDKKLGNYDFLSSYLSQLNIKVFGLSNIPEDINIPLTNWYTNTEVVTTFNKVINNLQL